MRIWTSLAFIIYFSLPPVYSQVVIENPELSLSLGSDGIALSLIRKSTGQECLAPDIHMAAFSVTQYRPYDNETMLTYITRPTVYYADSISRSGDTLFVGFDHLDYIAVISLKIDTNYIGFKLEYFLQEEKRLGVKVETKLLIQNLKLMYPYNEKVF